MLAAALLLDVTAASAQAPSRLHKTLGSNSLNENAGSVRYDFAAQVRLSTTEATCTLVSGTATAGQDFNSNCVVTTPFLTTSVSALMSIRVTITDDMFDENNETFTIRISHDGTRVHNETITIRDNDPPPSVSLSLTRGTVREGDGNKIMARATLSVASGKQVTVDYRTVDGSAKAPGDYNENSGTLTFAPGDTTKDIEVTVVSDGARESTKTFVIEFTAATNATLGTNKSVTATILNELFNIWPNRFSEDAGKVRINIWYYGVTGIRLSMSTEPGTATPRTADAIGDYHRAAGHADFPGGDAVIHTFFPLTIVNDTVREGDEYLWLVLNGTRHRIVIEANDQPAHCTQLSTVSLSANAVQYDE